MMKQLHAASWKLAVQEGSQLEDLKLVFIQFRRQRLAVWIAGRGLDPSFTAMVFRPCGRVLWPELRRRKASSLRTQASWKLPVQESKEIEGLQLGFSQFRKQRIGYGHNLRST